MLRTTALIAALMISAPAHAGQVLWQKVEQGMTFEQVMELNDGWTRDKFLNEIVISKKVSPGGIPCTAVIQEVQGAFGGKRVVDHVKLHCRQIDVIMAGLIEKYGPPQSDGLDEKKKVYRRGGRVVINDDSDQVVKWIIPGVRITVRRDTDKNKGSVTYKVGGDAIEAASGL